MSVQDDVNEIVKAKKAADERTRIEGEARKAAFEARQNAVAAAKNAAQIRWPEIKRELAQIVETYNAQSDAMGITLTLEPQEIPHRGWGDPQLLVIHGAHRTLSIVLTIGETNLMGYTLTETMPGGHRSAIPEKMPKQGGVTDIAGLVKKLVVGVMERSFR